MRSDRSEAALLAEMRESIRLIQRYVEDISVSEFGVESICRDATAFRLLMIGEVAKHLQDSTKARLPDIDWRGIVSLRHRLAHDYPSADTKVLWAIATVDVPALADALDRL